ncbi:DNA-binding protein [Desulfobacter hydrogenophilus]|uniref:DNA-binding protein n=1 Tax=Desulfobacter hydrogenophilus TaxID=2291 RepID=A0A328F996_9BACT|nr:helix-turn-helix transcriptional regulator [Desulfobacter hydrogenophilus]NDY71357.1 helix-turn-helix transcriptional regulator [Desulfobacter hydrogenophilus]QBH12245.1 helix-turn-helix domain-containing protein [Desulfobacter hydrogenophilus]RAM01244.1 DNA-binding protein [Desulfobacter hydrogenophilus]
MDEMLTTRQVAKYLNVNEKMVYSLIADKGLPASKVTGKWLFPIDLVCQWVENGTQNFPEQAKLPPYHGLVLISGADDLLLDTLVCTFNLKHSEHMVLSGLSGSLAGLKALRKNLCHIACCPSADENNDTGVPFKDKEIAQAPAVVNLCHREQGLIIQKDNPLGISSLKDLSHKGLTMVNRRLGTGTRQLLDRELKRLGIDAESINGYETCVSRHMDAGLAILNGNAQAAPGIRAVANLLGLDFISLCWERFDLFVNKDNFFDQGVQLFLAMLKGKVIQRTADELGGYDLSMTGKMVYPETGNDDEQ